MFTWAQVSVYLVSGECLPGLRCPTVSARLPLFTLVMNAQRRPDSVIFPPTTWKHTAREQSTKLHTESVTNEKKEKKEEEEEEEKKKKKKEKERKKEKNKEKKCFTLSPSSAPVSAGTVPSFILLFSRILPIRRSPSLDGCHVTGCWWVTVVNTHGRLATVATTNNSSSVQSADLLKTNLTCFHC